MGGSHPGKPKKPRRHWKPRFVRARRKKKIKQKLKFKMLTAARYNGVVKKNYELAYGIGLGIVNTTAKAFTTGNSVTSGIVKLSAGVPTDRIQEQAQSFSLVDEEEQTG